MQNAQIKFSTTSSTTLSARTSVDHGNSNSNGNNPNLNLNNGLTQASCTLCRRRKVKCDRSFPCGNCQRNGAECEPYTPSRAPRGRQGGRKRKRDNGELMDRLARLEGMVKDIEGQDVLGLGSGAELENAGSGSGGSDGSTDHNRRPANANVNGNYSAAKPSKGMDKYMASSFFVNLTEEINGLKDVLGASSDDEDDNNNNKNHNNDNERTPASGSSASTRHQTLASNHSGFMLSSIVGSEDIIHPTPHQVFTFCDVYLANVDPVIKLLHAPSLRRYLQDNNPELDGSPGPGGLEALRFAIYYAAVTSMGDEECKLRVGEDKGMLLARYRRATEFALTRADFVNTVEMSTLQALVIHLVAVRTNDTSRYMWTLTSVAIRIGQAMGMHYEPTSPPFSLFEQEMRRRLWWMISDLDTHAAIDRASCPMIFANSHTTCLPMQINDEDISPNSTTVVAERDGFTDMTFALGCNEIFDALRKINHSPLTEAGQPEIPAREAWSQRIETAVQFQRSMQEKYLCRLNLIRPFHWFTRMVADIVTATLWLFVYRPLQRYPKSTNPSQLVDPGILRLSIDILEREQQLITDPAGSQFKWISETFVKWHALSVAAAELCVNTEGPMVEKAWAIIEPAFAHSAQHVADSDKGMLWRPVKKLMKKAREVRQRYLDSQIQPALAYPTIQGQDLNAAGFAPAQPNFENSASSAIAGGLGDNVTSFPMQGHRQGYLQEAPMAPAAPFDWSPWLNAASAGDLGEYADKEVQNLNEGAWMNWLGFVDDVKGQDGSRSGTVMDNGGYGGGL